MNETMVKYLAGLLDADGSLSFSFKHDQNREGRYFIGLSLRLTASDAVDKKGFVESLPETEGCGSTSRYGENKQFVAWCVSKRSDLEILLPRLVKHMVIKAKHWQWMLDVWRDVRSDRKTVSLEEREALTQASKDSRKLRVGPLKPKNHPTWAWLAGYLDGDGWYSYRKSKSQYYMEVGAVAHINDSSVLYFLQEAFGGRVVEHGQSENVKKWIRSLGYQNKSFAVRFLPNLAKHSKLKREKIDAIISHHRQRLTVPGTKRNFCNVEGCDRRAHGLGMCSMHYQRHRKADKV